MIIRNILNILSRYISAKRIYESREAGISFQTKRIKRPTVCGNACAIYAVPDAKSNRQQWRNF